jgi:hypothetical protein
MDLDIPSFGDIKEEISHFRVEFLARIWGSKFLFQILPL